MNYDPQREAQKYLRSIELMEEARDKEADSLINMIGKETKHIKHLCDGLMELQPPDVQPYETRDIVEMGKAMIRSFRIATDLAEVVGCESEFKAAIEDFVVAED